MEPHVVLFPFMSKGHTIPILHLARLLCSRRISVTVFTTPANRPFIARSIADTSAAILDLPFPQNVDGVPAGIESTDQLPTISLYFPFATATAAMQPHFERALQNLPEVSFMVSDGFLWWTLESAHKFGFPRVAFYGMSGYAMLVSRSLGVHGTLRDAESEQALLTVPDFPWIKVTKNEFHPTFTEREPKGPHFDLVMKQLIATENSFGMIFNSFYELEAVFADYWTRNCNSKGWWIGPLCLAEPPKAIIPTPEPKPYWIQWLDHKSVQARSVIYIAFGSQAEISKEQLKEIAIALEKSEVNFMWVIRSKECEEIVEGFEERVKERGVVVREWVDQREILLHRSVRGFMSHCGWNSVMESVCAGVPMLAWPMMAEQPLNARMVVEELKVGLRVETCDGTVKWEGLEKTVRELMEGEMGEKVRKTVTEYSEVAKKSMEEGGSSWRALDLLIDDTMRKKKEMGENGPVAADVDNHHPMQ